MENKMTKKIIKWLLSKLDTFDFFIIPIEVLEILDSAGQKIDAVEALSDISSEGKRSMVYGTLIKRHPETSRRHIAMAIEIVLNGRK